MKLLSRIFLFLGLCLCMWSTAPTLGAQVFTRVASVSDSLISCESGKITWGDYDQDGDLDLAIVGLDWNYEPSAKIYRNNAGVFADIHASLTPVKDPSVDWGDYDNDGDLDIVITGDIDSAGLRQSDLYRNDAGTFTNIHANLVGIYNGASEWGDYDGDGDLDILVTGYSFTSIYRNDGGTFAIDVAGLPPLSTSSAAWGDCDNDGDLDLALMGSNGSVITDIYRNDAGTYHAIHAGLSETLFGSLAWGDYDNDGDLDLLKTGGVSNSSTRLSEIYRNDAGTFTNIQAGLIGASNGSAEWGDYDNDGDLDLLILGIETGLSYCHVYRNDAGVFTNIQQPFPRTDDGFATWADYNNDGDLDIVIMGDSGANKFASIYRNTTRSGNYFVNAAPQPATGLSATQVGITDLNFSWTAATDARTPTPALSYRLWIGTAAHLYDVAAPMADTATGLRTIAAMGNIQGTSWTLSHAIPGQTYFACVSAIDGGFMGSPCSSTVSFLVGLQEGNSSPRVIRAGPNPTTSTIHIALKDPGNEFLHYTLLDISGQAIPGFSGNFRESLDLDLQNLAAGPYFLQLAARGLQHPETLHIIKLN